MNWLSPIISKTEKLAVGLMSGTSMDGIDAALVRISGSGKETEAKLEEFLCREYSEKTKKLLLSAASLDAASLSDLNFTLGREFSDAVFRLLEKADVEAADVDLVGSHGQTVFHNPPSLGGDVSSTLQLGEPDVICEATGITTVADFRTRDVAAGGEGAPLIPYVDYLLFSKTGKKVIAQNIGGISNCTLVTGRREDLLAFDTGPGNSLIDSVARLASEGKKRFDEDGAWAARGSVNGKLLEKLMSNPYFEMEPPKSTGKELFGEREAEELFSLVRKGELSVSDLLRTLVEFTVLSIVSAYERFVWPRAEADEVVLSGGGAANPLIVSGLRGRLAPKRLSLSDEYGVPADAKEALGFAVLANETLCGSPANVPAVTGARGPAVLGKISIGRNAT